MEELRRQLSDKQELLAAAAEAIDVLGQQVYFLDLNATYIHHTHNAYTRTFNYLGYLLIVVLAVLQRLWPRTG